MIVAQIKENPPWGGGNWKLPASIKKTAMKISLYWIHTCIVAVCIVHSGAGELLSLHCSHGGTAGKVRVTGP